MIPFSIRTRTALFSSRACHSTSTEAPTLKAASHSNQETFSSTHRPPLVPPASRRLFLFRCSRLTPHVVICGFCIPIHRDRRGPVEGSTQNARRRREESAFLLAGS